MHARERGRGWFNPRGLTSSSLFDSRPPAPSQISFVCFEYPCLILIGERECEGVEFGVRVSGLGFGFQIWAKFSVWGLRIRVQGFGSQVSGAGGVRRGEVEPGRAVGADGARRSRQRPAEQPEPGGARRSPAEPGRARRSLAEPGGARRSWWSQQSLLRPPWAGGTGRACDAGPAPFSGPETGPPKWAADL